MKQNWKIIGVLLSANLQIIFVAWGLYELSDYLKPLGLGDLLLKKVGALLLLLFAGYSYFKFFKFLDKK
jgi:hypothetical protein